MSPHFSLVPYRSFGLSYVFLSRTRFPHLFYRLPYLKSYFPSHESPLSSRSGSTFVKSVFSFCSSYFSVPAVVSRRNYSITTSSGLFLSILKLVDLYSCFLFSFTTFNHKFSLVFEHTSTSADTYRGSAYAAQRLKSFIYFKIFTLYRSGTHRAPVINGTLTIKKIPIEEEEKDSHLRILFKDWTGGWRLSPTDYLQKLLVEPLTVGE